MALFGLIEYCQLALNKMHLKILRATFTLLKMEMSLLDLELCYEQSSRCNAF